LREEVEVLGFDFSGRCKRSDEMIEVLRMLWKTGSAEFHGEHFDFPKVHAQPLPGHPIPLYVGGHTDAAIRRAARCDGWMGLDFAMEEIPAVVEKIRAARRDVGRESEPFEIFLSPRGEVESDTYRRLEDMGVTAVLLPSWALLDGDFTSLDAKRRQMEAFAKTCL
jgi:alkanesulfonate monooxygenase SsuD/methylene tetrahydromethanopterin reductase-like flavin-dependent oxidoreductase (luciferase family)